MPENIRENILAFELPTVQNLRGTTKGTLRIHIDPELKVLINQAVQRTGLSKGDVIRQGLRKGIPKVVLANPVKRRTLVDALLGMKGLKIPNRRR